MGTLFNQPERKSFGYSATDVKQSIHWMREIAADTGLSFDQVLRVVELEERERTNALYHANGDIHDEQMTGLGELLLRITDAQELTGSSLNRLATALHKLGEKLESVPSDLAYYFKD